MANEPLAYPKPAEVIGSDDKQTTIVQVLEGYRHEAVENRRSGINPRDDKYDENLALYWNRYDFSQKADWQSRETMPQVPMFVDRFAAALKEALVNVPEGFYTVVDPADTENDLAGAIKRMTDVWLSTAGYNQIGQIVGFPAVFEEQIKMGALMASSGVVLWKNDTEYGRVCVETVDPRQIWLDHTYRNLYRIRRTEVDAVDVIRMLDAKTIKGNPLFNVDQIGGLMSSLYPSDQEIQNNRETLSGSGQQNSSGRKPIVLDEYIATVVDPVTGKILADQALMVVANESFLVRGPEPIPFWHGSDWLVYTPLMVTPLSPYGRTYMEDFGSIARTYTELTNAILDAVRMSSINAYAVVPAMLTNPQQALGGVTPGKTFLLEDGYTAQEFAKALELGKLDGASVQVWENLKNQLSEAAGINEIGLGQFAPNSRTSATEIGATQQSSSAVIRSVAQTVETRFLDPMLDRVWKTGVQNCSPKDRRLADAAGPELFAALMADRKNLVKRNYTFQARGISTMIARGQQLQSTLQLLQVIAQNQNLLAAFMEQIDINKLIALLFRLSNVDLTKMQASPREQMIKQVAGPLQAAAANGTPSAPGLDAMGQAAQSMGLAPG